MENNHGLKFREPLPTEWVTGGETGIVAGNVDSWTSYLPYREPQGTKYFDTMACTHFAAGRDYEAFVIYRWKNGLLSEDAKKFYTQFLKDPTDINSFRVSKQFSAILGKNTKHGNYVTAAWDTYRKIGVIPDSMLNTINESKTWEEYHDPKHITQEMLDFAKESLKYSAVMYQWLAFDNLPGFSPFEKAQVQVALKTSPLNVCIPIPSNHSVVLFSIEDTTYGLLNTYDPAVSHVPQDNPNVHFALQAVVTNPPESPTRLVHTFLSDIKRGMRGAEVYALQQVLVYEGFLNKNLLVANPNDAFFGENTFNGVIKLQEKYANDILHPLGLVYSTGFVGSSTRAWLNKHYGN